jgi:uncharacterized Zn-finger protein
MSMMPSNQPSHLTPEIIVVPNSCDQVKCDGGGGPLGHPLVYYSFDGQDQVDCMYCDRRFVKQRAAKTE